MNLRIVADENIPGLDPLFGELGTVERVNGRSLQAAQLKHADVLLVRSVTRVNQDLLAGSSVRFVGSATIGTDHLDIGFLEGQGIAWANAPGSNANSVVEYVLSAFARIDGLLERLLAGARVGIVGMGNVGSRLYQKLDALGIACIAYDPLIPQNRYPVLADFEQLLTADVLCLHTPLSREGEYPSFHLFNHEVLEQLPDGMLLLNAGRGAVIDNSALLACLQQGQDLQLVLDVWEDEPAINTSLMDRVALATPHIAGYSYDGKLAGTQMIYHACCRALGFEPRSSEGAGADPISLLLEGSGIDGLREAILAAYDIGVDDQLLRQTLGQSGPHDRALEFDRLRKEYPVRREFSAYQVQSRDTKLAAYLKASGFVLSASSES